MKVQPMYMRLCNSRSQAQTRMQLIWQSTLSRTRPPSRRSTRNIASLSAWSTKTVEVECSWTKPSTPWYWSSSVKFNFIWSTCSRWPFQLPKLKVPTIYKAYISYPTNMALCATVPPFWDFEIPIDCSVQGSQMPVLAGSFCSSSILK